MFGNPIEKVEEWFLDVLATFIQRSLFEASCTIKDIVEVLSGSITATPQKWNPTMFTMLKNISDAAIIPIAIGIMTIIICYDLITACIDRNNMKEFDTSIFFRFIVKAWVAIYFINNVFTICGGIFELGSNIADTAIKQLFKETLEVDITLLSSEFHDMLVTLGIGDLLLSGLLVLFVYIISLVVLIIVMVVTAGRMIEILIYFCASPIPFATMTNKEWSNVGFSFLKNLLALALQAFFITITLAIYVILFKTNVVSITTNYGTMSNALVQWICYSIVCCFTLLKTGSISKSICGGH